MVAVVLSYAGLFSDMGISTAFVQRQQISHEERSSLYWLSVSVGLVLMLLVMAASPLAAAFFNEPELVLLMIIAATNFLVIALGQQLRMDAEKNLNFRPVAIIEMVAALLGFTVAVIAAWLDWGVYALVAAAIVSAWLTTILSWMLLAKGWRPTWRLRWDEVRWFVHFGGGMIINSVINHVNSTVDLLLGGHLFGASQFGLYSVPRNLIMHVQSMINPIITRVGFPLIASIQNDKVRVREIYKKTMNMTASINAPVYVAIGLFAPEIVLLLLGERWLDAAPLLRALAFWGLFRSFGNPVGSLLFGLGRVRLAVRWNAGLLLIVPPTVWFGSNYGAIGMAMAMAVLMVALFIPGWSILIRTTCELGLWEYSKEVVAPTFCALLAGGGAWLIASQVDSPVMRLIVGLPIGAAVYIAVSLIINRSWCSTVSRVIRGFIV